MGGEVLGNAIIVKPFVLRVELRKYKNEYAHLANGAVADARPNEDTHPWTNLDDFVVQLHFRVGLTLKEKIGLGKPFVVM